MRSLPTQRAPTSPEAVTERLRRSFEGWRALALHRHVGLVVALALLLALRWWSSVSSPGPVNDEIIYLRAFGNVARGESAYARSGYLAFPLLAHLGGGLVSWLGELPTLLLLRAANLCGISLAVWCSLSWIPGSIARRWLLAAAYLLLAPAVGFGMWVANVSLLVAGLIVAALLLWPRRPLLAGSLLAASVVVKPLAPAAVVTLALHRSAKRARSHLLAAGWATLIIAACVLVPPDLARAMSLDPWHRLDTSVSPHRIAHLLGLRGLVPWISIGVLALIVWLVRRRPLGPAQLVCAAVVAASAATPVVWSHTLLLTLPLQAVALAILWTRRGADAPAATADAERSARAVEIGAVVLAVAAIQLSTGATNIYDASPLVQWAGVLPPVLAPWILLGYVLERSAPF